MRRLFATFLLLLSVPLLAQNSAAPDRWAAWQAFLGAWQGVGSGAPGEGDGEFSFTPELQGAVLVRHSYAVYPATKDKPAYRHDDLMVVYRETAGKQPRADYWDNEGHVIHYTAELSDVGRKLVFVSDAAQLGPRFRLTYVMTGQDTLRLTFEIAPPGAPEKFSTYIEAAARRKRP